MSEEPESRQTDSQSDTMSIPVKEVRDAAKAEERRERYREQKTRPLFDVEDHGSDEACGLIVLEGKSPGRKIAVPPTGMVIGRSSSCDLQVGSSADGTSRAHCRVHYDDGPLSMEDLNSRNGTLVNNRPCERRRLYPGDKLQIGASLFKVISGGEDVAHHEAIYAMARRDPRTGLFEADSIEAILTQEIKVAVRYNRPLSVWLIDLDHYDPILEQLGELVAKDLAVVVGKLLLSFVRSQDLALHYSGRTMMVVMPHTDLGLAVSHAERFCRMAGRHTVLLDDQEIGTTVSIGVAQFRQSAVGLVQKVKEALQIAQNTGGNRVSRARRMTRKLQSGEGE